MARRRFGLLRKLPSGRWQASFTGPDGRRQTAPTTFATKSDADRWLAKVDIDLWRGTWLDEAAARIPFGIYARQWLEDNRNIGPRWRETCERNLRLHMGDLDGVPLKALSPVVVRGWYAAGMRSHAGKTSLSQSYRFVRAVLNTAVRENVIAKNPCQIPGAGVPRAKARPIASPDQVVALVEAIPAPYRAAVLLAAWGGSVAARSSPFAERTSTLA